MSLVFAPQHVASFTPGRLGGGHATVIVHHVPLGTMAGTFAEFAKPDAGASSNYGIGSDGKIVEYVPPEHTAWANGNLREPELWIPEVRRCWDNHLNPNSVSISVEWEGRHGLKPGAWTTVAWRNPRTNELEHLPTLSKTGVSRWWVPTPKQLQAGIELCRYLSLRFAIPLDRAHVLRHSDWDRITRWFCPGAGFPMQDLLDALAPGV